MGIRVRRIGQAGMFDEPLEGREAYQLGLERDETWAVPEGWLMDNVGVCRGSDCHRRIAWAVNATSGKKSPFDQDGRPHWASCPNAGDFKRRKG